MLKSKNIDQKGATKMKIEYEQIKEGIFKGYTVAYERKYVAVFSKDAEYKRSSLAHEPSASNFYESDREEQLLHAYCFDLARQLVSCCLTELKKEPTDKDERLFKFKIYHEISSLPQTLKDNQNSITYLLDVFDFYAIKNLKSIPPEREKDYCRLVKKCHDEIERNTTNQNLLPQAAEKVLEK